MISRCACIITLGGARDPFAAVSVHSSEEAGRPMVSVAFISLVSVPRAVPWC